MTEQTYRILEFQAENLKRITVVDIKPGKGMVEIAGNNGNGKTSVLDAIAWALAGSRDIQWKPIRKGEKSASIKLALGDDAGMKLKITRTFHVAGENGDTFTSYLKIEDAGGRPLKGEQTFLNTIIGAISLDPLNFAKAKVKDQVEVLKAMVPGFDFDDAAKNRQKAYDARTEANRDVKRLDAQIRAWPAIPEGTPAKPIDTAPLMAEFQTIGDLANKVATESSRRRRVAEEIERMRAQALEWKTEGERLLDKASTCDAAATAEELKLHALPAIEPAPDAAEITARLNAVEEKNKSITSALAMKALITERVKHIDLAEKLTAEIAAIDASVTEAIEGAKLPVRGLSFDAEMVTLNGLPFDQASDAEQLRASVAIAMAANPKLRVIRIRDGSLLDDAAMAVLAEVAEADDYQVWIERVKPSTDSAIIMEEGHVKGAK